MSNPLDGMTQAIWDCIPPHAKEKLRDLSDLSPQLIGLEGWRVEVIDATDGTKRRFIVGRSTDWRPCHIEISRRSAFGGPAADHKYASVTKLYRVR